MPIRLRAIPEHRVTVFTHTGSVPDDEFLSFYKAAYEERQFDVSMDHLVDLREADSSLRSPEALRVLADSMTPYMREVRSEPKVAVIAPRVLSFGLARMYEAYAQVVPWEFVVFRDPEAACAWLGLPEELTREIVND
jgi:hypothetical protein